MVDESQDSLNKVRILYVEDDFINQIVVKNLLKSLGFEDIVVADDAQKTLKLLENSKNNFDIILMDIGLPDIDGISLTEKIRQSNFKLNSIPIIAISGNDDIVNQQKSYLAGMNGFLSKPVEKEQLLLTIKDVINKKIVL